MTMELTRLVFLRQGPLCRELFSLVSRLFTLLCRLAIVIALIAFLASMRFPVVQLSYTKNSVTGTEESKRAQEPGNDSSCEFTNNTLSSRNFQFTFYRLQGRISRNKIFKIFIFFSCLIANCKMLPIHMGPEKTFCRGQKFWQRTGSSSLATIIQGNSNNYW